MRKRLTLLVVLLTALAIGLGLLSVASAPAQASVPGVTKVLIVVEENHSLSQMQTGMPYTFGLAMQYGYATKWFGIRHPSLPNYIAIASGDTYGVADDKLPSQHLLHGQTIFGQAIQQGKTAKAYMEDMSTNCRLTNNSGNYRVKHNPWAYFVDNSERTACNQFDVGSGTVNSGRLLTDVNNGTLPNIGMLVPNLLNDAHDGTLAQADAWFQAWMQKIFAGPDWQSGNLAVVLTADENSGGTTAPVLTMVIHPSQNHRVVTTNLTHYSLTRFCEDLVGAPYLLNAATAPSMTTAFGF